MILVVFFTERAMISAIVDSNSLLSISRKRDVKSNVVIKAITENV